MANNPIISLNEAAETALREAIGDLVQVDNLNRRYRVSLPIMMPSGGLLDISVYPEPGATFLVSDDGAAFFEVSGYGITRRSFSITARNKADRVGAEFDGNEFLFMRITLDHLKAAIIAIGNLSVEVAREVVEKHMRAKSSTAKETLIRKVGEAFPSAKVTEDVDLYGASTASYQFDALVEINGHRAAFDLFTKDPISIAATYTKLSDVSRAEDNPSLIGVTRNPNAIGPKLALISSVARVIKLDSTSEVFQKSAA
ncbi:hypothetical protein [Celeribacter sp.]|uniref:hypothetical protein n=1 Tax=Celeribacter sp. TaxID=1890673 RepID=UPI003A911991